MKETKFRIKLKNPCQQDWDQMPKTNGGIYCGQCSKVVQDFTRISDEELIRVLKRKNSNEICGKFYNRQLEKVYLVERSVLQKQNYSLQLVIAGFLSLPLFSQSQNIVQKPSEIKRVVDKTSKRIQAHENFLQGKVINRITRSGIAGKVFLYSTIDANELIDTIRSDSNGHYSLLLPDNRLDKFFKIVFKSEDFLERSVVLDRDKLPTNLVVSLFQNITSETNKSTLNLETLNNNSTQENSSVILLDEHYVSGGVPQMIEDDEIIDPPTLASIRYRLRSFFIRALHKFR